MLFKIAMRNVRRCARDYAIYFITVVLGVSMFYAFNAISSQTILFDALSPTTNQYLAITESMIKLFSIVVACVLGFLVVYANRFLIRRRKREFGTYLILGMTSRKVSRILFYETALVGLASLVVGLILGIALSQGLAFVTAWLMNTTMSKYEFIVSARAIGLTLLCFIAIYFISVVVDIIYLHCCKLSSLLNTHKSVEGTRHIPTWIKIIGFVVSILILAAAYWQLHINGLVTIDKHFVAATILMIVGTVLFFWSITGCLIALLQRLRGFYFRGIRCFTIRQISSKINTAFASISIACVMLFFALTVSTAGMGMLQYYVGNATDATSYDNTLTAYPESMGEEDFGDSISSRPNYEAYNGNIATFIRHNSTGWNKLVKDSAQIDIYLTDISYSPALKQLDNPKRIADATTLSLLEGTYVEVVSVSQYNQLCRLQGKDPLELGKNECVINNLTEMFDNVFEAFIQQGTTLTIAGKQLHFAGEIQKMFLLDTNNTTGDGLVQLVVPNSVIASIEATGSLPNASYLNIMYNCDRAQGDKQLEQILAQALPLADGAESTYGYDGKAWPVFFNESAKDILDNLSGMSMLITYLALYIGFVMLVATAAILAIQQLSETADSLSRYRQLSVLGCSNKQIFASLRTQTIIYFVAPLLLATCHTLCALKVLIQAAVLKVEVNLIEGIAVAVAVVLVIYLIYLLITYVLSKNIVRNKIQNV